LKCCNPYTNNITNNIDMLNRQINRDSNFTKKLATNINNKYATY